MMRGNVGIETVWSLWNDIFILMDNIKNLTTELLYNCD